MSLFDELYKAGWQYLGFGNWRHPLHLSYYVLDTTLLFSVDSNTRDKVGEFSTGTELTTILQKHIDQQKRKQQ